MIQAVEKKQPVRILLVDDDEMQYMVVEDVLSTMDSSNWYIVDWVTNSKSALDAIGKIEYHLCMVDYNLGEENGIRLLKDIKEKKENMPVMLISGSMDKDIDIRGMEAGAVDFLQKGDLTPVKLERAIRYAVHNFSGLTPPKYSNLHYSWVGLPNRTMLLNRVKTNLAKDKIPEKGKAALLSINVNAFYKINDEYGYGVGDEILREISTRISKQLAGKWSLYHLEGDHFALYSDSFEEINEILIISNKIHSQFARPFMYQGKPNFLNIRSGIAIADGSYLQAEHLLRDAIRAAEEVKNQDGVKHVIYQKDLGKKVAKILEMERELRLALERGEFEVYYQPIVDLENNELQAAEALLRWNHPRLGQILPQDFISLAEETGLIGAIGNWVLKTACEQAMYWQISGFPSLRLAVNFSAKQFSSPDVIEFVDDVLKETGFDPGLLEIELTETTAVNDKTQTLDLMTRLAKRGIRFSMDDFGTGFSSLSSLASFPITHLKIDKSFVGDLEDQLSSKGIIKAIISMANYLKIKIIAEGVETDSQREFLKSEGCQEFQGFLYSKPLPVRDFTQMLQVQMGSQI